MTLEYRDVIILVTWSKFYFSKMWRQQSYMSSKVYKLYIFEIFN